MCLNFRSVALQVQGSSKVMDYLSRVAQYMSLADKQEIPAIQYHYELGIRLPFHSRNEKRKTFSE